MSENVSDKKGSLMFMSISDLFSEYLKDFKLENYEILIISQDIVTDIRRKSSDNMVYYESRFKNIDFVPEIFPNAACMEYLYGGRKDNFGEMYMEQLARRTPMINLCSIIDMVVNEHMNVILCCSDKEYVMEFFEYMREYVMKMFELYMISFKEFKEDNTLLHSYGDDNAICTLLAFQINRLQLVDELTGKFINKFTDDMINTFKDILQNKSVDELYEFAKSKNIHVNKRKPKDVIISHIIERMVK